MSTPLVCCVCLTADRQRLTDRAARSFLAQTYENRELLIYDNGREAYQLPGLDREQSRKIIVCRVDHRAGVTIPRLRNEANGIASGADVIAHWDSDDWSHQERLAVQMQSIRHHATGFSNMLFFDSREGKGNAWEYIYQDHRLVLGSSLMYWRPVWEVNAFNEAKLEGEEKWWPSRDGVYGINGFTADYSPPHLGSAPLMIADYHGSNTGHYGKSDSTPCIFDQTPAQRAANPQWRRAPEWDEYCREAMK